MTTVISVENLSKKYIIGHQRQGGTGSLRESLTDSAKRLGSRLLSPITRHPSPAIDPTHEEFWALKDVSFDIQQGDRVGIIGRNGAGKSTLLKILSRITEPTSGKISIRGRVASLLEVGTGFHPELSGRENIFLNGAILGMSKVEIKSKFDEIVAFAEVERFLDTPVKRYSSGMYVRLAFAVAAHLEPEILIVDEVLAVGDARFQKKCLGKMDDVGREGRTILFVSHNMGMISQLCTSCIWMNNGEVRESGPTAAVVNAYMMNDHARFASETIYPEIPEKLVQLRRVCLENKDGELSQKFDCDEPIGIKFDIHIREQFRGLDALFGYLEICRPDGMVVMASDSFDAGNPPGMLLVGMNTMRIVVPPRTLGHGEYMVKLSFASNTADNFYVVAPDFVCSFTLDDFASKRGNQRGGFFSTLLAWEICQGTP